METTSSAMLAARLDAVALHPAGSRERGLLELSVTAPALLLRVLAFMTPRELSRVSRTCRRLQACVTDDLWRPLYVRKFPLGRTIPDLSWKQHYRRATVSSRLAGKVSMQMRIPSSISTRIDDVDLQCTLDEHVLLATGRQLYKVPLGRQGGECRLLCQIPWVDYYSLGVLGNGDIVACLPDDAIVVLKPDGSYRSKFVPTTPEGNVVWPYAIAIVGDQIVVSDFNVLHAFDDQGRHVRTLADDFDQPDDMVGTHDGRSLLALSDHVAEDVNGVWLVDATASALDSAGERSGGASRQPQLLLPFDDDDEMPVALALLFNGDLCLLGDGWLDVIDLNDYRTRRLPMPPNVAAVSGATDGGLVVLTDDGMLTVYE